MKGTSTRLEFTRILTIAVGAALVATVVIPGTRELHVLTARLLFRIHTENTYVQGQPPGCVIYIVPNTKFTDDFKRKCLANSGNSPDTFVLATSLSGWDQRNRTIGYPPLESWEDHPILVRAALEVMNQPPYRMPDPVEVNSAAYANSANSAQNLIHRAQEANPGNGAIWLAEAHVHLRQGADDLALQALKIAAEKKRWRRQSRIAFLYRKDLFQDQGLSELDATIEASSRCFLGTYQIRKYLCRLMTEAIAERDDEEFKSILTILRELQQCVWKDRGNVNRFRFLPVSSEGLFAAMSERLGRNLPGRMDPPAEMSVSAEKDLTREYLTRYVSSQVAGEILNQNDAARAEAEVNRDNRWEKQRPVIIYAMYSSIGGTLSLFLLSAVCAGLLLEVPFALMKNKGYLGKRLPRSRTFWAMSIGVFTGMVVLLASAFSSDSDQIGLASSNTKEPFLDPMLEDSLAALALGILWFGFRVYFQNGHKWFKAAILALCILYITTIGTTAVLRHRTVENIESGFAASGPAQPAGTLRLTIMQGDTAGEWRTSGVHSFLPQIGARGFEPPTS